MTDIFAKLKLDRQQQHDSTLQSYFAFLAKLDPHAPKDADAAKLADFLRDLNRTPEQAEQDRADVLRIVGMIDVIDATKDAARLAEKLHAEHLRVCAERQAAFAEQNREVTEATMARDQAVADRERHLTTRRDLAKAREADPILFGAIIDGKTAKRLNL